METVIFQPERHGYAVLQEVRREAEKAGEQALYKAAVEELALRDSLGRVADCSDMVGDDDCHTRGLELEEMCLPCRLWYGQEGEMQAFNELASTKGLYFALGALYEAGPVH